MSRYAILNEIKTLDPVKDHQRIAFLSGSYDFPWDTQRAYELALLRTFAIPRSAKLLVSTEEFTKRTQKRYDDTSIIISTIGFYGYDSEEGRAAIRRMNQIHKHYPIPNDEYLYVLSTFIYEPIYWNKQFGWRPLSKEERLAAYYFWREVGKRMNIKEIPEGFEAFETYKKTYEEKHFAYSDNNRALAVAVRDLFLSWYFPKFLWPLGEHCVYALLDAPLRQAFAFPPAKPWVLQLVKRSLLLRAFVLRRLPPRKTPFRLLKTRTYPQGHKIENLGPSKLS